MKLATLRNGRPDGQLVVVSKNLELYVSAGRVAPTLQAAIDDWAKCAPELEALSAALNKGDIAGQPFDQTAAAAPLPRAFQWIDAAGYLGHLERVRSLKGSKDLELQSERPLMYQGGSDSFLSATDKILVPDSDLALDLEAEVAVITGPVPMRATKQEAADAIILIAICNDVSLRRLVVDDLENGFGFFHAKPATSFGPVVATPDELGEMWRDNRLHATIDVIINDDTIGSVNTGADMHFDFADLVAAATQTRQLGAGTIVGSGTIANTHDNVLPLKRGEIGFACIAEARTVEKVKFNEARTPFLEVDDRVRINAIDANASSIFGEIDQRVALSTRD